MPERLRCDLCDMLIPPHAHYVLRMELFADPTLPEMTSDDLAEMDFDETFRKLIAQMKDLSAEELEEQVHKRMEFKLCPRCQREFLTNPLGKPRRSNIQPGSN